MSQEFPTASLDITEDFHILHSAYVYICYSIRKAKSYNWLPNKQTNKHTHTHTHTRNSNNYKQKATRHVTSLANGHLTGSDVPFVCEIPITSINKKRRRYNFADSGLAVGTPAGFASAKACFKLPRWFG